MFSYIVCFLVRIMSVEIYTERLFKIPNIATKCKYCVCWLVLQEMSKIPMFPDAPIYVMYMLVFAYLQILFAFFLLLHQLPLRWYFCHLDTVFAASLPPFLLTSATRGALVLETKSNYSYRNVLNIWLLTLWQEIFSSCVWRIIFQAAFSHSFLHLLPLLKEHNSN